MPKYYGLSLLIILAFNQPALSQSGVFICADSDGNLIHQETPCPLPPTDPNIRPIQAAALNEEVLRETVDLFRQAFANKDVDALGRLFAPEFRFVTTEGSPHGEVLMQFTKPDFLEELRRMLPVITDLDPTYRSSKVIRAAESMTLSTAITERVRMGPKWIKQEVLEQVTVKLTDGVVRIAEIHQVEL